MEYHPKNVLVTGGAGFIGCNFVRYLLTTDPQVNIINLDLLTYAGSLNNLTALPDPHRHEFVQGDIGDRALVDRLLNEQAIDTIVHFAAESHVDRSITGPAAFIQTNLVGTFTLLEAARAAWTGRKSHTVRFHHISTDEVYGTLKQGDPAFTETMPYAPNSPYSASKAGADHLVRAYFHTYGLPVTTTNCSNNYGPYQHGEKFIPTVIRSCLQQQPIPVYGDGSNIRDWLYVEDHCRGIDVVIRRGQPGETYNIGGCNEWANIDIAEKICALMDERYPRRAPHKRLLSFVADRPGHDWRYAMDTTRIATQLQWRPLETFETGIVRTVDWYLDRSATPSRGSR
jgi:dTDP-glucose 4,6-dehydratase